MKHFSEQVWADYVRGVGSLPTNRDVATHVASGCPDCVTAVGIWRKVSAIAANEASLTPPDHAVRMVKLEFAASQSTESRPWTLATLLMDSLSQPLTAGVRSGASESRQLMFEAEGTMVDLVLDTRTQSGTVTLVGQVVDKGGTKVAPRHVSVTLWTETGQPLAEATANEFGEFQLEFETRERLRLSVEIAGYKRIRIPPLNLNSAATRSVT